MQKMPNKERRRKSSFKEWVARRVYRFRTLSVFKHILIFYFLTTLIGAILLYLPISQQKDAKVSFIDAFFTAASAFSDTGLVIVETYKTWSYFGQAIIAILILIGGIGLFSLRVYIFNILLRLPFSYNTNMTLSTERGNNKAGGTKNLIKVSITILFCLILIFSLILTLYFYYTPVDMDLSKPGIDSEGKLGISPYQNWESSFRFGLFHAISALNNAGFDIIGPESLTPYYFNYSLQLMFILLFVIGGIGYPVIYDTYLYIKAKILKKNFRWSLFSKLSMTAYLLITLIGLSLVFIFEMTLKSQNSLWNTDDKRFGDHWSRLMALIFNTMSTRNAGFATINMYDLSRYTLFVYIILMFIGSAPSSTAGGIRTTTIAIIFMGIWNKIRGRDEVRVFKRIVAKPTVERAYIVFATSIMLVFLINAIGNTSFNDYGGVLNDNGYKPIDSGSVFASRDDKFTFLELLFEVSSAFGTTGLSTGLTRGLSTTTKTFLIIIMFIGQLGVSSTILLWGRRNSSTKRYSYIEEEVTIG